MNRKKITNYAYGNISSLFWSVFLLLGGAIFVSYYANIGYMPDFDFKSAITLLSAASITAALIVFAFVVVLIMPGAFWVEAWAKHSALKKHWENNDNEKRFGMTTIWFGVPILIYYFAIMISIYSLILSAIFALLVIIVFYIIANKALGLHGRTLHSEVWKMLGTYFVCALLAFFPIYVVATLSFSDISTSKGPNIWIGFVSVAFIAFINACATMKPSSIHGFAFYGSLGFIAFFIIFSSFEMFHKIPERVMQIYKFGAIYDASIVFKSDGCDTLKEYGITYSSETGSQCLLSDAKILSRLGSEMYIQKGSMQVAISNSNILSWSSQVKN